MYALMEVSGDGLMPRPVVSVPRADAWAYEPEHLGCLERARSDVRAGEVRVLDEAELDALAAR